MRKKTVLMHWALLFVLVDTVFGHMVLVEIISVEQVKV